MYSQSVQVYLSPDVCVGRGHHERHDVVVVPTPEVLVLETGAVVHPAVEVRGQRSVEHPAQTTESSEGMGNVGYATFILGHFVMPCVYETTRVTIEVDYTTVWKT